MSIQFLLSPLEPFIYIIIRAVWSIFVSSVYLLSLVGCAVGVCSPCVAVIVIYKPCVFLHLFS